jgi:hypothetical protein
VWKRFGPGAQLIFVFAITLSLAGVFATIGADPHHDSILLKPAIDVARGKVLFSESFTQYGALTTLIQAGFIRILGERLMSIRIATVVFIGLYSVFFWLTWSKLMKPAMATLACLSALGVNYFYTRSLLPWSSEYALLFEALGGYLFFRYLRKNQMVSLFASGASAGLAFWCKQSTGPFMAFGLAIALIMVARNRRDEADRSSWWRTAARLILIFSTGFAVSFAPFLIWLAWSGALSDWYLQSIKFALFFASSAGSGVYPPDNIRLRLIFAPLPWNILPIFCAVVVFSCCRKLWRGGRLSTVEEMAGSLSLMSLPLIAQYYPVPDHPHFYWAGVPAMGILFYGITRCFRKRLTLAVVYVAIFASAFKGNWLEGSRLLRESVYSSDSLGVVSGIKLNKEDFDLYQSAKTTFDRYTRAYPDMRLLNATPDAMWVLFVPDYPFHPVQVHWLPLEATAYPEYPAIFARELRLRKHLLLTWQPPPEGYTKVLTLDHIYALHMYVPNERLLSETARSD